MQVIGDFEHETYLYLPGDVAVFRKCRDCGVYKTVGSFDNRQRRRKRVGHRCYTCRAEPSVAGLQPTEHLRRIRHNRSITITESGRQLLKEIREEEARELEQLRAEKKSKDAA